MTAITSLADAIAELVHPGATVEQALAATGWELAVADELETIAPPTETELAALRRLQGA